MTQKIISIALLTVFIATAPVFAGPYPVSFPVEGTTADHQLALTQVFEKRNMDVRYLTAGSGVIKFFAGGHSPQSVLKLSEVAEAVNAVGLKLQPETWVLNAQTLGVLFSDATGVDEAIYAFKDAEIKIIGTVSMDGQTCKVLELSAPVNYSDLTSHLEKAGLKINDLVWAHWQWGWGVEEGEHDRSQSFGAVAKE